MGALLAGGAWFGLVVFLLARVIRQSRIYDTAQIVAAAPRRDAAPGVAVIVPVRNEAANIGPCLAGLLAQTYPADSYAVLVVDDGSQDGTAEIVAGTAADAGARVELHCAGRLPSGWLGKPHACWHGVLHSRGAEWLCFMDADVRAAPDLLRDAIGAAEAQDIAMLSLRPLQELGSFWERLIVPAGMLMVACAKDLRRINDPSSPEAEANGQFILIRRDAYAAVGGHAAVRGEICEDTALARRLKGAGFRLSVLAAEHLARTRMYRDLPSLWEGFSKNAVEIMGNSERTLAVAAAALIIGWAVPLLPLALGDSGMAPSAKPCGGRLRPRAGRLAGGARRRSGYAPSFPRACRARPAVPARRDNGCRLGLAQRPAAPGRACDLERAHVSGRSRSVRGFRMITPDRAPTAEAEPVRDRTEIGSTPHRSKASGWAIFTALVVVAVILFSIRVVLLPFIIAIGIGFVLDPVIQYLQRRSGLRRGLIATVLYILLLLLFAAAFYWLAQTIFKDVSDLVAKGPSMIRRMLTELLGPNGIEIGGQRLTPDTIANDALDRVRAINGTQVAARIGGVGVEVVLGVVLMLVLIPYFLLSGPDIAESTIWLVPPERRESLRSLLPKVIPMLRRYLVGIACVVTYTAILAYLGYGVVFHLPHAILLSIAIGLLEIIPSIGPTVSFLLVGLAAMQDEHSLLSFFLLFAWAVALRLSIDNVFGPIVLGRAVNVPRVVILFAFVCGGVLFGIIGLILAVPVAACTKIVLEAYYSEPIVDRDGDEGRRRRTVRVPRST